MEKSIKMGKLYTKRSNYQIDLIILEKRNVLKNSSNKFNRIQYN